MFLSFTKYIISFKIISFPESYSMWGEKGWQCSLLPADVVNLLISYLQWHQPQIYIHFLNHIYEQLLCSFHLLGHLFVLLLKKAQFLKAYFEKNPFIIVTIFKNLQPDLKGKPFFPFQHPKQIPFFTSSVGILVNLWVWKYPGQDSPPVTKQHMLLTEL